MGNNNYGKLLITRSLFSRFIGDYIKVAACVLVEIYSLIKFCFADIELLFVLLLARF